MNRFSTKDVDFQRFRPHGRIDLSIANERIAIYDAEGPFNRELIIAIAEVEQTALKVLREKGCFGKVVVFNKSCMAPAETLEQLHEHLIEQRSDGTCHVTAFVIPGDIEGSGMMASQYQRCYKDTGVPFRIFADQQGAVEWISEALEATSEGNG